MSGDPHAQAEKIYEQMLALLEHLTSAYAEAAEMNEEDDEGRKIDLDELTDIIVEEAVERGLEEEDVTRIFKSIAAYAKKASEA